MKLTAPELRKHFPFFENQLIRDLAAEGNVKIFQKGEYILRKGQYLRYVMIVLDGLVKVFRENGSGSHFFMHYLTKGEAMAFTMLYDNRQEMSEISAVAFEKTRVIAVPLSCMDKWMAEYKGWYEYVFNAFRERISELLQLIDHAVFLNVNERLIQYLKLHQSVLQSNAIPLTRTTIARELNSSREVVTRLLKKMSSAGKLKMHRNFIELIDLG